MKSPQSDLTPWILTLLHLVKLLSLLACPWSCTNISNQNIKCCLVLKCVAVLAGVFFECQTNCNNLLYCLIIRLPHNILVGGNQPPKIFYPLTSVLLKQQQVKMPVSEEILDDRNGCNTQKKSIGNKYNNILVVSSM